MKHSIEFESLSELLSVLIEIGQQENIKRIDIRESPNGYSADVRSVPYEGTEGQDRDNYTDDQDREFYTTK